MGLEIKMKLKLTMSGQVYVGFFSQVANKFSFKIYSAFRKYPSRDRKVPASYAYRGQMVPIFPPICFLLGVKIIVFTISLLFYILYFYTFRCCGGCDNGRV